MKKLYIDDSKLSSSVSDRLGVCKSFGKRNITHVFHDIDGTHSLIRDWVPVMSLTLSTVIEKGLPDGYDSESNVQQLVDIVGKHPVEETDRFCIESAGLSALTQMEWAIRRAIEAGTITAEESGVDADGLVVNSEIIGRIWNGEELFDDFDESAELRAFLQENTPRLFQMYERILNGACRDENVALALKNPDDFLVKGSHEFIKYLHDLGAVNYFVTGAVIHYNDAGEAEGGMYEEVCALGFEMGADKVVEAVYGSTWNHKIPKDKVMEKLCVDKGIDPSKVLIVGDGRSEIAAGTGMGAVMISRLPVDALQQRELHVRLGTNMILADYCDQDLFGLFYRE